MTRPASPGPSNQQLSVLVVEDKQPFMKLMAWSLEQDGFTVDTSGIDDMVGVAAAGNPSAVVFNMRDAKNEKRERIEQLRAACDGVCVVDVYEDNQPDVGADGYLVAPVLAADLSKMIHELCDGRLG